MIEEQNGHTEQFDWDSWTAQNPETRQRGAELFHRIGEGLPLSPREQAISEYTHNQYQAYRELGSHSEDTLVRLEIDAIGSFLNAASTNGTLSGVLADMAQLSDERPEDMEAIK